jgi:hypothetical protein
MRHQPKDALKHSALIITLASYGCGTGAIQQGGSTGDTSPPVVTGTLPLEGAGAVALNTLVGVTFDEPLDANSIGSGSLLLQEDGQTITGTLLYDPALYRLVFEPAAPLSPNRLHTATATTLIADVAGNSLSHDRLWTFTTGDASDSTPPLVSNGRPSGTLSPGTTSAVMSVTTDEPAICKWDASSVSYAAMASSFANTGGLSHDTMVSGLVDGQSYTFHVRCVDGAGNAMSSSYEIAFSVADGASPITISIVPSRLTGAAPLAVFFDASGTTGPPARPYHHMLYAWSFDDPASGAAWTRGTRTGAGSKNEAYGPIAAHVFETPGSYAVSLTVHHAGIWNTSEVTIEVSAPDAVWAARTLCIANGATPVQGSGGCPSGAFVASSNDFDQVVNGNIDSGCGGAGCRRFLFRTDHTFTSSGSANLDVAGPGLVGSYGGGAKPVIDGASSKIVWTASDWRVVGLRLDGEGGGGEGFAPFGYSNHFLALDNDVIGASLAFHVSDLRVSSMPLFDTLFIVGNTVTESSGYGFLGDATRLVMMGNLFDNNQSEHLVRTGYCQRCIHSNNEYGALGAGLRFTVRAHGNFTTGEGIYTAGTAYTEKIHIAENRILRNHFSIRSSDSSGDARMRDIIVENNYLREGGGGQGSVQTEAGWLTMRNNLLDHTGSTNRSALTVNRQSNVNVPDTVNDYIEVYNNTAYSSDTASDFRFVVLTTGTGTNHLKVQNNLTYVPGISGAREDFNGNVGTGTIVSHNSDGTGMSTCDPAFAAVPGATLSSWRPSSLTCAVGIGTSVPVWDDFFRELRSVAAGEQDYGAVNP